MQVLDDLAERNDLVSEEINQILICASRGPQHEDVLDLGRIITGLCKMLAKVYWMV